MATGQLNGVLKQIRKLVAAENSGQLSDRQLLERYVQDRDEAAFTALVNRHGAMVLNVCQRVLHNHSDAEDACQATFLVRVLAQSGCRRLRATTACGLAWEPAWYPAADWHARRSSRQIEGCLSSPRLRWQQSVCPGCPSRMP
jgi:hypothetical protein